MHTLKYRPDIDGLRAVAVLLVLIYHAFPGLMPGGFIGVDIFFVISGFLISGIIFKNLEQKKFSLTEFYARRIRRIFPALAVVLATCLTLGWGLLFADEFNQLGKHSFKAALFVLNFTLAGKGGYFDIDAVYKPLLHLWSLSIEEQYYILWPVAVMVLWRYARKAFLPVTALLLLASFLVNLALVHTNQNYAFYFPQSRFWELLVGSLLAYWHITSPRSPKPLWLSLVGTGLIAFAASMADDTILFPGWWALLPTIGALLIIHTGPDAWLNRMLLARTPMVAVGLISYPLYLWHWPILAFARIITDATLTVPAAILALLLSFILAFLTYALVEKKIRFSKNPLVVPVLVAAMALIAVIGMAARHDRIPVRLLNAQTAEITRAVSDRDYPGPSNFRKTSDFGTYRVPGESPRTILVIGDSHAEHYWPRIHNTWKSMQHPRPSLLFTTYSACPPLPKVNRLNNESACHLFYDFALQQAGAKEVKTIVFAAWWELYFGKVFEKPDAKPNLYAIADPLRIPLEITSPQTKEILQRFAADLMQLHHQGKKIYIVLPSPSSSRFDPKNGISRLTLESLAQHVDRATMENTTDPVVHELKTIARQTGAILIDPVDRLCAATECPVLSKDGKPLYKDDNHLRPFYAREKAGFIDQILQ